MSLETRGISENPITAEKFIANKPQFKSMLDQFVQEMVDWNKFSTRFEEIKDEKGCVLGQRLVIGKETATRHAALRATFISGERIIVSDYSGRVEVKGSEVFYSSESTELQGFKKGLMSACLSRETYEERNQDEVQAAKLVYDIFKRVRSSSIPLFGSKA